MEVDAGQSPHRETDIQAADVQQQTLEHVGMPAQMYAAQSSDLVEMGMGTLEAFPTLPQQAPPADAAGQAQPADVESE